MPTHTTTRTRCAVVGCSKIGTLELCVGPHEYRGESLTGEDIASVYVCEDDGPRLGEVVDDDHVLIKAGTATGWRLLVEVRPSAERHVLVLYPPGADLPA